MTILDVKVIPYPTLRQTALPVAHVDEHIIQLMNDMAETMYHAEGIGLAANQVGILERVIVVDVSEKRDGSGTLRMANPVVLEKSRETFTFKEGCLSVRSRADVTNDDLYADVTRPKKILARYLDEHGEEKEIEAEDLLSICLQHEIDHLDGTLFIDRISSLKRSMMIRKINKAQRVEKEE